MSTTSYCIGAYVVLLSAVSRNFLHAEVGLRVYKVTGVETCALPILAEYVNMITLSALAITLFLGGWHFPFAHGIDFLGPLWFFLKLLVLLFVFIWLRATLPRLR